ncbi:carotenoid oxygenase family protein [Streptomyces sp. NPDC007929]|uniref:carotenoid oxygenase family protein n=1 Tax=unclassified Streptomyces TaxID=2593676 RepID=UPI0036EC38B1
MSGGRCEGGRVACVGLNAGAGSDRSPGADGAGAATSRPSTTSRWSFPRSTRTSWAPGAGRRAPLPVRGVFPRPGGLRRVRRGQVRPGDARLPSGAVFVAAAGAASEDDGYLLTVVSDLKQDASQLLVLDASGLDGVAAVHLPRGVTAGICGSG